MIRENRKPSVGDQLEGAVPTCRGGTREADPAQAMTDIVERLRAHSGAASGGWIMKDAADEIERLRTAAEDALATLEAIELLDASRLGMKAEIVTASCDKLHRALEPKP